jgi:1-phosphatidylinositol-3-phosphate 5-kinase
LELFKFSTARSSQPNTPLTSPPEQTPSSSFFSGYKLFTSGSRNQPDPDQEGVVWNEPEQYHSVISRKESSRGHASRLGMRDILVRQKTFPEPSLGGVSTPVVGGLSNSSVHAVFAKAKPEVVGSVVEDGNGKVDGPDTVAVVDGLVLQELGSVTMSPPSSVKLAKPSSPALPESWLHAESEKKAPSVEGGGSEETVRLVKGQDNTPPTSPPLPPKDFVLQKEVQEKEVVDPSIRPKEPEGEPATSSSFATTIAGGINSAMRFITNAELPFGTVSSPSNNAKLRHALLLADIDERPHIKYDWTIGKRLKFSCTVYYAKQFDALRRRCGINDLFLKSLISSVNWSAQGGKSRSNFWKTSDDRFIIKSLVNAWNVADLYVFQIHVILYIYIFYLDFFRQVLIELAPSYFRYMDATASKATVLAKLLGFYTIEIKNLETGAVQSKADLLVTENLFYDRNISKTFDLKGIQGRKVKTQGNRSKTLFDGDWIEGTV